MGDPVVVVTVWKNKKFSRTKKIFRQINSLVTYLVNQLLSRNFCQKWARENFRNFHNVVVEITETQCGKMKNLLSPKKIRQTNSLVFSLVKTLLSRNFCQRENFSFFCLTKDLCNFLTGQKFVKLTYFVNSSCAILTEVFRIHDFPLLFYSSNKSH